MRKLLLILTLLTFTSIASAEIDPELMQKAKQGDAKAQFNVGQLYAYGWGVPEDAKEAMKWYRLAADQGYANAQYNLGVMYVIGEGVPLDNQLGYLWVNIAGENGYDVDEAREIITSRMSQADIAKAQQKTSQYIKDNPGVY